MSSPQNSQEQKSAQAMQDSLSAVREALKNREFAQSLALAEKLTRDYPLEQEGYYLLAVSQRYQGKFQQALHTLDQLLELESRNARAYQERGHNFSQLDNCEKAAGAFRRAVELNPALPASWKALAVTLRESGQHGEAEKALQQFKHLNRLPPELVSAASLLYEKKLYKAEQLCRGFLQRHPHHPEAMRLLALVGTELGILDDADFLLESCLELYPEFHQARFDYIGVLRKRQKFAVALQQAEILRDRQGNRQAEILFATQSAMVGDYETALAIYDRIACESPESHTIHLQRGHALKTIGRAEEANAAYRAAYTARADFGDAYWSLANMKTYRFSDEEIERMSQLQAAAGTALEDRYHLCFALGKALEDRQQFSEAFSYYETGNGLKLQECRYSIEQNQRDTDLQIEHCNTELFVHHEKSGCNTKAPIFIVGLPRAGSTLIEQILASHSMVDGTLELHNIMATARRLDGRRRASDEPRYPAALHQASAEQLRELGERFIEETRIHRGSAPMFIDKMPNNFRHIGLIRLMLPNAKIIDARRHPMSCCFSGFKQLFADGQEFTYGLEQIGEYYRDYLRLMDHWDAVLPGRVLRVHYEAVVEDLESQVRRLLEFCGLPFEEPCLNFHETERAVRTPSAEQVRQPIYRTGMEQWKNFAEHLKPLENILAEELRRYPLDIEATR